MMEQLQERLREAAIDWGADLFGVADMTAAHDVVLEWSGPVLASYQRGISVGIKLPNAVVDQLPDRLTVPGVVENYGHHAYDVINNRLDLVTSQLASLLQREGYNTLPLPAAMRINADALRGHLSNKMLAHLAGLGWIGKSCLLVTPDAGPRVRWASILTMAPLEPGQPMEQRCGDCRVCVDACPVGAFTGRNYVDGEPRERRYNAHKCSAYLDDMAEQLARGVCGMCLYSCPVGRQANA